MATSFTKRAKEQKRLEKRQQKADKMRQREADKAAGIVPEDDDMMGTNDTFDDDLSGVTGPHSNAQGNS